MLLFSSQIWSGSKDHRTTLLSLVSLRPNDAVTLNVFKYGIQAVLLAKGEYKISRLSIRKVLLNDNDVVYELHWYIFL